VSSTLTTPEPGGGQFAVTHWSVVLAAGRSDSTHARSALEKLCRTYWQPIYAYVRRQGHGPHDAQDLTQEFFARLLEKNSLADVDRGKGRFRSFLLASLKHFLANEWDKAQAQKRGGGQQTETLEADAMVLVEGRSEELIDLDSALARLATIDERQARVVECRFFGGMSIEETAEALQLSPATVKREWTLARAWLNRELSP